MLPFAWILVTALTTMFFTIGPEQASLRAHVVWASITQSVSYWTISNPVDATISDAIHDYVTSHSDLISSEFWDVDGVDSRSSEWSSQLSTDDSTLSNDTDIRDRKGVAYNSSSSFLLSGFYFNPLDATLDRQESWNLVLLGVFTFYAGLCLDRMSLLAPPVNRRRRTGATYAAVHDVTTSLVFVLSMAHALFHVQAAGSQKMAWLRGCILVVVAASKCIDLVHRELRRIPHNDPCIPASSECDSDHSHAQSERDAIVLSEARSIERASSGHEIPFHLANEAIDGRADTVAGIAGKESGSPDRAGQSSLRSTFALSPTPSVEIWHTSFAQIPAVQLSACVPSTSAPPPKHHTITHSVADEADDEGKSAGVPAHSAHVAEPSFAGTETIGVTSSHAPTAVQTDVEGDSEGTIHLSEHPFLSGDVALPFTYGGDVQLRALASPTDIEPIQPEENLEAKMGQDASVQDFDRGSNSPAVKGEDIDADNVPTTKPSDSADTDDRSEITGDDTAQSLDDVRSAQDDARSASPENHMSGVQPDGADSPWTVQGVSEPTATLGEESSQPETTSPDRMRALIVHEESDAREDDRLESVEVELQGSPRGEELQGHRDGHSAEERCPSNTVAGTTVTHECAQPSPKTSPSRANRRLGGSSGAARIFGAALPSRPPVSHVQRSPPIASLSDSLTPSTLRASGTGNVVNTENPPSPEIAHSEGLEEPSLTPSTNRRSWADEVEEAHTACESIESLSPTTNPGHRDSEVAHQKHRRRRGRGGNDEKIGAEYSGADTPNRSSLGSPSTRPSLLDRFSDVPSNPSMPSSSARTQEWQAEEGRSSQQRAGRAKSGPKYKAHETLDEPYVLPASPSKGRLIDRISSPVIDDACAPSSLAGDETRLLRTGDRGRPPSTDQRSKTDTTLGAADEMIQRPGKGKKQGKKGKGRH